MCKSGDYGTNFVSVLLFYTLFVAVRAFKPFERAIL